MAQSINQKYRTLTKQLANIGYICQGSIGIVYTRCGNDYCACAKNPHAKHGPYFMWTRKEKGKTVSKRLDKKQVTLLKSYMKNYNNLKNVIAVMKSLSEKSIFQE